jgi:hypothetical protein
MALIWDGFHARTTLKSQLESNGWFSAFGAFEPKLVISAFIVLGSLATAMLQSRTIGVNDPVPLAALGVLNLGGRFMSALSPAGLTEIVLPA